MMGRRKSIETVIKHPCDPGIEPNKTIGEISVYIKIHWPAHADIENVLEQLTAAYYEVINKLDEE